MSLFDAIKVADDLEEAVLKTLRDWFPVYIREVELQSPAEPSPRNIPQGSLPLPRSYLTADQVDKEAGNQLPSIVVISPGLSSRHLPQQEGDGTFNVPFNIAVGIFVSADERKHTIRLVRLYTAIVRAIMLQKQSFGGFAGGSYWLDESYDDRFTFMDDQTISAGQVIFEVWVSDVVNRFAGPVTPPDPNTQPGSDWGKADDVYVNVEPVEDVSAPTPLELDAVTAEPPLTAPVQTTLTFHGSFPAGAVAFFDGWPGDTDRPDRHTLITSRFIQDPGDKLAWVEVGSTQSQKLTVTVG